MTRWAAWLQLATILLTWVVPATHCNSAGRDMPSWLRTLCCTDDVGCCSQLGSTRDDSSAFTVSSCCSAQVGVSDARSKRSSGVTSSDAESSVDPRGDTRLDRRRCSCCELELGKTLLQVASSGSLDEVLAVQLSALLPKLLPDSTDLASHFGAPSAPTSRGGPPPNLRITRLLL